LTIYRGHQAQRAWVTFLIEQTEKGPQTVDVARMDEETDEPEE
jgi:hypothetical protein